MNRQFKKIPQLKKRGASPLFGEAGIRAGGCLRSDGQDAEE